jgi:hypothetical protein
MSDSNHVNDSLNKGAGAPIIPPTEIRDLAYVDKIPSIVWYRTPPAASIGVAFASALIFAISHGNTFVKMNQEANIDATQKTHRDAMKMLRLRPSSGSDLFRHEHFGKSQVTTRRTK